MAFGFEYWPEVGSLQYRVFNSLTALAAPILASAEIAQDLLIVAAANLSELFDRVGRLGETLAMNDRWKEMAHEAAINRLRQWSMLADALRLARCPQSVGSLSRDSAVAVWL
jgi:hypothetical protein